MTKASTVDEATGKHPSLVVRSREPLNAGPPLDLLTATPITPTPLFYVRNHGPVPAIDAAAYRLAVDGLVERPLSLSMDQLREGFPRHELVSTLQCAGNRRDGMSAVKPTLGEIPWGAEGIGTASWAGARLSDVLTAVTPLPGARHVAADGLDDVVRNGESIGFGASVPLDKALAPETLLCYEMNGEPLTPMHGAPLRLVVPGYIGARSVKWLGAIHVQEEPSANHFQARSYKLFPPHIDEARADWSRGLMLHETSVNAVISWPAAGATVGAGSTLVRGYATAGGARTVERVDVSADGGREWREATLLPGPTDPWAWRLWEAEVVLGPGTHVVVARAWDSAANTQPEDPAAIWNFKGYMNNAWHRVEVEVRAS